MRALLAISIVLLLFLALPNQAKAQDCTGPNGDHGVINYNNDFGVWQACTPQGWVAMNSAVCPDGDGCNPDACDPANSPTPGTICADDTIYAGTTVGGVPMYAARCDHGQSWDGAACIGAAITRAWKTTNTETAGTTSLTDGMVNTDAMATAGLALHPAAGACRNLGAEWYLPARDELATLWENLVDQNGDNIPGGPLGSTFDFNTSGSFPAGWYWSSSESTALNGRRQIFSDGNLVQGLKNVNLAVRCVRR